MHNENGASAGNKAIKIVAALVLIMIFITFGRLVWGYIDGGTMTIETGGCHPDAATTGIMDAATKAWINSGCNEVAPVDDESTETHNGKIDGGAWTWLINIMQGGASDNGEVVDEAEPEAEPEADAEAETESESE